MEASQIIGYVGALIVGLVLGLIGGGGSILTVPLLVYLLGTTPLLQQHILYLLSEPPRL